MTPRDPKQVARRALICAALDLRWSVEEHPDRVESAQVQARAPAWLEAIGAVEELLPLDRALLLASPGSIPPELRRELVWGREYAGVLAWALGVFPAPPATERIAMPDASPLYEALHILSADASAVIVGARLRPDEELLSAHARCVHVKSERRRLALEARASDDLRRAARNERVLDRVRDDELARAGIRPSQAEAAAASAFVTGLSVEERKRCAGIYMVRSFVTAWLVGARRDFYEAGDSGRGAGDDAGAATT